MGLIFVLLSGLMIRLRVGRVRIKEREKAEVNKRISELKLQALRAQMNPHFIFNALNSIQSFYSNNDEISANKYMTTFSSLIRQILNSSSKNLISIKDEVTLLTSYIELEKMRYKGKFDYNITLSNEMFAEKIYLPIMLIQPYVENAINHGLRFLDDRPGLLDISFDMKDNAIICTIDDNGIGFRKSQERKSMSDKSHISAGIQIGRNRIDTLNVIYGRSIEVTFTDKAEQDPGTSGVRVTISLPIIDQNNIDA
jgi:LytS/YehU family sensor histidine kinase